MHPPGPGLLIPVVAIFITVSGRLKLQPVTAPCRGRQVSKPRPERDLATGNSFSKVPSPNEDRKGPKNPIFPPAAGFLLQHPLSCQNRPQIYESPHKIPMPSKAQSRPCAMRYHTFNKRPPALLTSALSETVMKIATTGINSPGQGEQK